jgi:hypothetical protein
MTALSDLRTDVRERIGEDTADFFTDAEVDRAINLAQTTFTAEEPWPWLYTEYATTISEGEDTLELPSSVSFHRFFNLTIFGDNIYRGRQLERLEPQAGFRVRHEFAGASGCPIYYYLTSASVDSSETLYVVKFTPTPDVDYDLEGQYLRVPAEMTSASDVPDMPTEYAPAIAAWAAGHLFLKEMSISQKAQEQFQLYFGVLAQARKLLELQVDEKTAWGRDAVRLRRRTGVIDRIAPNLGL